MIDLSFLTEEEHETILRVLQRDAQLKMAEEKRIKSLQRSVKDRGLLKYLSGEWFYERKLLRHRDRIHGCDIIRASIRHKHKPVTLLELSQMIPEKPSFVASVNKEVYIPPELCGLIPEDPQNRRNENWISFGSSKETPKSNIQSPTKLRKNPFNQEALAPTKPPEVTRDPASANNEQAVDKPLNPTPARHEGYDEGDSSPVRSASKQRQMPMSQSMENLGARTEEDKGQGSSLGQLNLSMDDVGAAVPPASLHPDPLQVRRMSKSVPALQQLEETDDDDDDESFGTKPRRRTTSVVSNLSLSSGLASMSSVSGSMTSISNGDFGDIEVQGTMQFALNYVQKLGELQIFVVQCKDLALAEPKKSRSDPYVKCYLVPDKTKLGKRKTTVKKRTLNPSYNEILRFKILMEVLRMQNLNISVWHNDTFGRNSFLGEISLDLSEWDFANTQINDYALTPRPLSQFPSPLAMRSKPTNKTGQMRVALRYLPQPSHGKKTSKMEPGEVQIWVKDCKDLPPARGVIIDPFVKCTVLPDTSKKSRQKTRVVKRTANPMFNHTMVYDGFRPEDLREACAEITVWDHDRLNNHYIGGLRLGLGTGKSYGGEVDWMDSSEPETNLWEKMMGSEGEWVEDILPLRTFVVAKSRAK
ncbi:synaptotagmin-like protein 2 isoform X9 [Gadus chalcogrammus]|uniref:synaptotagmin-like protein 2 isoform X9 n=1 Tax=Gadus chalcogrammus TaxID=1042646 RepID=UPI0024C3FF5F|nr:synaptotagmin-like protein 2 isoform X9 [Gadus chalcogrammus]